MKKIELLSPVGKKESMNAAIQNGADAIYLSGKKFGARAYANNFEIAEIKEVVKYAHAYSVKVYVTMNTLVYDDEMDSCLNFVDQLYQANVDALIIQDLGVLYNVRKHYPNFEVHASTQMHVYNADALKWLVSQGVKRAVLARECTLAQLKSFQDIPIEKEIFVHGALCISFSGQCLFSSMNNSRSGNRGMCAQGCRMPYELLKDGKKIKDKTYLLSPKDMNVIDDVEKLKAIGIDSLKIEGRMKSSEYVGFVSGLYRSALDQNNFKISKEDEQKMKVLFHRGYTKGHLLNDSDLMSKNTQNHIGIKIGEVIGVQDKIVIRLTDTLNQHDGVRFLQANEVGFQVNRIYKDGLLVNHAVAGDVIEFDLMDTFVSKGVELVKTKDIKLEEEIQRDYLKTKRRVSINAKLTATVGNALTLQVYDDNTKVIVSSNAVEQALKRPTTIAEIENQLMKTGNTIYEFDGIDVIADENIFIPIKTLNELRREALDKFYEKSIQIFSRKTLPFKLPNLLVKNNAPKLEVKVHTKEQLQTCLTYPDVSIYVENKKLYEEYANNENVLYCQNNVTSSYSPNTRMAGDIGAIDKGYKLDTSLNIINADAVEYLERLNNDTLYLSLELKDEDIKTLMHTYQARNQTIPNVGLVIYGKTKLMSSKYCPIRNQRNDTCEVTCDLCKQQQYKLKDIFKNEFLLEGDDNCIMHMYHHEPIDKIESLNDYKNYGIQTFRLDFVDENKEEIHKIFQKFQINNQ